MTFTYLKKTRNILKAKLFVSIHIFMTILQVNFFFEKHYNTIKLTKVLNLL